ncbi:hypothetical protein R3P38DRAFT_2773435 [Favolaschia claudopus]|uniref:Uncharacterized protein n=1 Tax=Favolaschia claudopus TaxID=2862362 RepID=A0AAW0C1Y6_9AGAR
MPMHIIENGWVAPTSCQPRITPPVDHIMHSASGRCSYYVITKGWDTGIFTNACIYSDVAGVLQMQRQMVTLDTVVLLSQSSTLPPLLGIPTANATTDMKLLFPSRGTAIAHGMLLNMNVLHLCGGLEENVIREFAGLDPRDD